MQRGLLIMAKIWSAISLSLMGLALIGQLFAPEPAVFKDFEEAILFSFFPIGVSIGQVVSWWKSYLIGGVISTTCLLIFHFMRPNIGLNIWIDGVFSAPGVLFLIYGITKTK